MYEDDSHAGVTGDPPGAERGRGSRGWLIYTVVAIVAAAAGVGATLTVHMTGSTSHAQTPAAIRIPAVMNDSAVYNKVEPGVVDIAANLQYLDETAEGTGIVINAAQGLVLTNNHVIDDATSVTVTPVASGRAYQATIVGYDLADDVAVLKITGATGLKAVTTGDSDGLAIGTQVLALGNEAGQGGPPTVAPGVISSMNRSIVASDQSSGLTETLHGMLQTSANIRPGDSGGPLANAAGQVVGVNTAAGSGGPGMSIAGYAIPINSALAVADQIAAGHQGPGIHLGVPAFLGVLLPDSSRTNPQLQASQEDQTHSGNAASAHGCITGDTSSYTAVPVAIAPARSGALVDGVVCGTAAAAAGLVPGDVITSFDGHPVASARVLSSVLGADRPGTRTAMTWLAVDGDSHTATITLGTGPAG
jgi:S1-C subfamily serine protease